MKKLTIEECQEIAKSRGGKCLSNIYINTKTKLWWGCSYGHTWPSTSDNVKNRKSWCPYCSGNIKLTQEFVEEQIDNMGGKLLSKYEKSDINMKIQCRKCENIWFTRWDNLKQGYFCPKCAKKNISENLKLKDGLNIAKCLAEENGGKCLSTEYINVDTKMLWECKLGHTWNTTLYKIKNRGQWCLECCGKKKKTIEDAHNIAKLKGGVCLSDNYLNSHTKMTWKCHEGHIWNTTFSIIQRSWCPECSNFKTQKCLANTIKNIFPNYDVIQNYNDFIWLKTSSHQGKQEFDIFVPKLKLAIEYDGEQHFMPIKFGGMTIEKANEEFIKIKKRDKIKDEKVILHKNDVKYFIRFDFREKDQLDKIEYVLNKLKNIGVNI